MDEIIESGLSKTTFLSLTSRLIENKFYPASKCGTSLENVQICHTDNLGILADNPKNSSPKLFIAIISFNDPTFGTIADEKWVIRVFGKNYFYKIADLSKKLHTNGEIEILVSQEEPKPRFEVKPCK